MADAKPFEERQRASSDAATGEAAGGGHGGEKVG